MPRQQSDATALRQEKSLTRTLDKELTKVRQELQHYRQRASKAEAEASEWKTRFDKLLERSPAVPLISPTSAVLSVGKETTT